MSLLTKALRVGMALAVAAGGTGLVWLLWALPKEFGVALGVVVGLAGGVGLAEWRRHS
jgi:hypothetical protein